MVVGYTSQTMDLAEEIDRYDRYDLHPGRDRRTRGLAASRDARGVAHPGHALAP